MSFWGNFLCCITCHSCTCELVGGTINLWGIFLLEGSFMSFSLGETFFSLDNFLFFASCFEFSNAWYGYLPFFFHSLAASRAVHRSKTGPDRTRTGLDRNRNHVFWRTGDRTGIIPVQTCPDLFIQVRSGFGLVWTCFVFFNICSLKSQNLHNKFSS